MTSENPETSRTVLRISGADSRDFLQNLVTNDVTRLDDGPVYAALLTPQGKLIADFILVADGADVLLDVATIWAAALKQRLTMYRLRADVTVEDSGLHVRRGTGDAPAGAVVDPRNPALGWRLYGVEGGDDGSDWDAIRVAQAVPASGAELGPDSYILEQGFERLNGVDFRKGCYVGQEVTARMKHKTELKKGLRVVHLDGEATAGAEITRDGKAVGTLHTCVGDMALAYLRFDRIGDGMVAGDAMVKVLVT
jgi:folate-binding protein YgfZ